MLTVHSCPRCCGISSAHLRAFPPMNQMKRDLPSLRADSRSMESGRRECQSMGSWEGGRRRCLWWRRRLWGSMGSARGRRLRGCIALRVGLGWRAFGRTAATLGCSDGCRVEQIFAACSPRRLYHSELCLVCIAGCKDPKTITSLSTLKSTYRTKNFLGGKMS